MTCTIRSPKLWWHVQVEGEINGFPESMARHLVNGIICRNRICLLCVCLDLNVINHIHPLNHQGNSCASDSSIPGRAWNVSEIWWTQESIQSMYYQEEIVFQLIRGRCFWMREGWFSALCNDKCSDSQQCADNDNQSQAVFKQNHIFHLCLHSHDSPWVINNSILQSTELLALPPSESLCIKVPVNSPTLALL